MVAAGSFGSSVKARPDVLTSGMLFGRKIREKRASEYGFYANVY
jgi:hypothetical protein